MYSLNEKYNDQFKVEFSSTKISEIVIYIATFSSYIFVIKSQIGIVLNFYQSHPKNLLFDRS